MPDQQIKGNGSCTNLTDGGWDHNIGYDTPTTESMKSGNGEIRPRSGYISHEPERVGINQ